MLNEDFPVSEQTRNEVWQGYLDAEHQNRYFQWLDGRYRIIYLTIKTAIAFAAVGGVTRLLGILPENWYWAADFASLLILVLVVLDLVFRFGAKSAALAKVSEDMQKIVQDWRMLWNQVDRKTSSQDIILEKINNLLTAQRESIALSGRAGMLESRKLNQKAWEEANDVLAELYRVS